MTFSTDDTFNFCLTMFGRVSEILGARSQIAQPQVCYSNAPKDTVDKKLSLYRRVSEAAKSQLGISISGSTLSDAIGSVLAPVLPASKIPVVILEPFRFSAFTNHQPYLTLSAPLPLLTRLSPNSLTLPNRTSPVGHLS